MNFRATVLCIVLGCGGLAVGQTTTRPSDFDHTTIRRPAEVSNVIAPGSPVQMETGLDMMRVAGALAVVIGLILVFRWSARRFFGLPAVASANRSVKVLARTTIAPRQQVLLLQVGRRVIVAADSGGSISALAQITDPDEVAELIGQVGGSTPPMATRFGSLFGRAREQFDDEIPTVASTDVDRTEPSLAAAQIEIGGLTEKVREISEKLKR